MGHYPILFNSGEWCDHDGHGNMITDNSPYLHLFPRIPFCQPPPATTAGNIWIRSSNSLDGKNLYSWGHCQFVLCLYVAAHTVCCNLAGCTCIVEIYRYIVDEDGHANSAGKRLLLLLPGILHSNQRKYIIELISIPTRVRQGRLPSPAQPRSIQYNPIWSDMQGKPRQMYFTDCPFPGLVSLSLYFVTVVSRRCLGLAGSQTQKVAWPEAYECRYKM